MHLLMNRSALRRQRAARRVLSRGLHQDLQNCVHCRPCATARFLAVRALMQTRLMRCLSITLWWIINKTAALLGAFEPRVLQPVTTPQGAASYADSYTGGFYDLRPFAERGDTVLELGRVCVDPNVQNADVLRRAWGALAQLVRVADVDVIIGCSSFEGTEIARHTDVLCHLFAKHGRQGHGTPVLLDGQAGEIAGGKAVALASLTPTGQVLRPTDVPPLLRTYLLMGGWIGDHAVIDPHMKTTHVFTALRVADVPEARKRLADSWA